MFVMNATDVRRDWSSVTESVVRERPQFIKRTRDKMVLASLSLFESVLDIYEFTANKYIEDDDSITLSLNEIDLIENDVNEQSAKYALSKSILEYAEDYFNEFSLWSAAPNRKGHIPYVLKALILDDPEKIGELITICQNGKS